MGLAERRAAEQFRMDEFPQWKHALDEAAGFEVPVEVAWNELAVDDFASRYGELFPKVYFEPLTRALTAITVDTMGREALREALTRIVVKNSGSHASSAGFSFVDGVLTMDHRPEMNVDYDEERAKALQLILESSL